MQLNRRAALSSLLITVLLCFVAQGYSQTPETPQLQGFVTRIASPTDFDINGVHVENPVHVYMALGETKVSSSSSEFKIYVGQPARVFGRMNKKARSIVAREVVLEQPSTEVVSGSGVIDAVLPLPTGSLASEHLLRADGYRVLIPASASVNFKPPLDAATGVRVNRWLTFHGTRRADGVVVIDKAEFSANDVGNSEARLRNKTEYDPAAVAPNAQQSDFSKAFLGIDPKRIPPYANAEMQARVEEIGAKLIPQYQRELPSTDPNKINFRFQVVNNSKWHDALALPGGIILVPRQVIERMDNDSQLAAVLADNIAAVLEKQAFHLQPAKHKMTAAQVAGSVGGMWVPGLGLATGLTNSAIASEIRQHQREQSSRVSLFLLQDAGFDIYQAPVAWWRLGSKDKLSNRMPPHAIAAYKALGESWRATPSPVNSTAQSSPNESGMAE